MSTPLRDLNRAARARWAGQAPLRVLVGPYHHKDHWIYMKGAFDDHDCLSFGTHAQVNLHAKALDRVEDILERLPPNWYPDVILLWRPEYGSIPRNLQHVDIPVVMLTSDWYVAFSDTVEAARFCNLTVTGTRGEKVLNAAGFSNVVNMPMLGFQPGVDGAYATGERDVDVYTATNPNFTVHQFRERVIDTLLGLPDHVELRIRANLSRQEYNKLLGRSRIFVNNTVIGEINMKVYEACAAGACLFLEEDHLDVHNYLTPGESVVLYNLENLNDQILYYLEHEDERAAIAARGHQEMEARSYRANMNDIIAELRRRGPEDLMASGREILHAPPEDQLRHYLAHALNHSYSHLEVLLEESARLDPERDTNDALLQGVAHYLGIYAQMEEGCWSEGQLLEHLHTACDRPGASLALRFALATFSKQMGDPTKAMARIEDCIGRLEAGEVIPFAGRNVYLVGRNQKFAMERAAWEMVEMGRPPDSALRPILLNLLYGQQAELHFQSGDVDAGVAALRRAAAAYPSGTTARSLLAKALVCGGNLDEAAGVLRDELRHHPLSWKTHPDLFQLQMAMGDLDAASATLRRFQRIARVFDNAELIAEVERMGTSLGEAHREARAKAPQSGVLDLSRPAALGPAREVLASS